MIEEEIEKFKEELDKLRDDIGLAILEKYSIEKGYGHYKSMSNWSIMLDIIKMMLEKQ